MHVEFHLHEDTLQARSCLVAQNDVFRFHAAFTPADVEAGWKQNFTQCAAGMKEADIEAKKVEIVEFSKRYWQQLAEEERDFRVVLSGNHYTQHPSGEGMGFGGATFRVEWLDTGLAPVECNLSGQGRVPKWIRDILPDNATRISELR